MICPYCTMRDVPKHGWRRREYCRQVDQRMCGLHWLLNRLGGVYFSLWLWWHR